MKTIPVSSKEAFTPEPRCSCHRASRHHVVHHGHRLGARQSVREEEVICEKKRRQRRRSSGLVPRFLLFMHDKSGALRTLRTLRTLKLARTVGQLRARDVVAPSVTRIDETSEKRDAREREKKTQNAYDEV